MAHPYPFVDVRQPFAKSLTFRSRSSSLAESALVIPKVMWRVRLPVARSLTKSWSPGSTESGQEADACVAAM
jgi:hypothetical protein